ncbi:dienelactone hydrolase endo-1,3,1,4-beta-D-glucanase [Calocera viscosa TUFC12733]|uniref:Dienelactone hydrolase endo-1,3,1,4-beta-D-glucanase n=1 Tax=Calocera viscosa (strain TUFC12733) TaxID=1330018 RepID=A0A167LUH9_CALVF|nr:dienelactone hydrolase endo-1,3,1,4-beta-D-glucanase [Calocera viscosa TUFC12733]
MSAPICENCTKGTKLPGTPEGSMLKIAGIDTYLATPPEPVKPENEHKAVVIFTDVLGLPLGNSQIIADGFAKHLGLPVYVPDMFNGTPPITPEQMTSVDHFEIGKPRPFWKKLRFYALLPRVLPNIIISNSPGKVSARMETWVEGVRKEKGVERLGAVGHCYGGIVVTRLAAKSGTIQVGVIAHPGPIKQAEIDKIDFPVAFATCEEDDSFPQPYAKEVETSFEKREEKSKVPYEFVYYPGTMHGFAARPALDIPVVKEAFEKVTEQTWRWFEKYL